MPGLAARVGALRLLGDVLDRGRMLDDGVLGGRPEDRAQALGLAGLVLRRLGQIDTILAGFVERMPTPPVSHALRLVAAELIFAETPGHAAIDMAVRATKSAGAAPMAGLVNAVGRRLSEAEIDAGATDASLNMPAAFRTALAADWGDETAGRIAAAHLEPPPVDLTPRDPAEAQALAAELGGVCLPNGTVRLHAPGQISALPGFAEGRWWVQDAAASLPVTLFPDPAGRRVLDLCAAPGGKTMQLAAAGAEVTALDKSERRMRRVRDNLDRTGLSATLVAADALTWDPERLFDAILLDAPCSATGTVRRHPDLPHRDFAEQSESLLTLQAGLLARAFGWLRPGGMLVYCTCSLFRSEGEAQVAAFLDRMPEASVRPVALPALPWAVTGGHLRTRPDHLSAEGGIDGFFAALIERRP